MKKYFIGAIILVCIALFGKWFFQDKQKDLLSGAFKEVIELESKDQFYSEGGFLFIGDMIGINPNIESNVLSKMSHTYSNLSLNNKIPSSLKFHLLVLNLLRISKYDCQLRNKNEIEQALLEDKHDDALIYYLLAYESLEANDDAKFEKYFLLGINAKSFSDFVYENKKLIQNYFSLHPKFSSPNVICSTANFFSFIETQLFLKLIEKFKDKNLFKENKLAFFNQIYNNKCSIIMGSLLMKYFNDLDIQELKEKLDFIHDAHHTAYVLKLENASFVEYSKNILEYGELNAAVLEMKKINLPDNKGM